MTISITQKLIKYLKLYKLDLVIVLISILCISVSLLMIGSVFRQLVDNGLNENYLQSINQSILFIGILIVIFSIGSFFRSYFINNIAEKIINYMRKEAYINLINVDIIYFEELKIGDVISRLTVDIELISKFIINFLSFFIRNAVMLVGGVTLMFLQSYKLALIVTIIIPLLLLPLTKFAKYVKALSKDALKTQAIIISNLEESFSNIRAIHSFNQQANKISDFNKQIVLYLKHASNKLKVRALFFALSILVISFSITIVIWIGCTDIVQGNLSSGQMISFIYYAIIAGASSGRILELLSDIYSPLAALERVFRLIDVFREYPNKISDDIQNHYNDKSLIAIEFKNICFFYKSRPNIIVLDNLSFKIERGKFVGIVGRSGAGKSTIIQLLLKFYSPTKGLIKIAIQDMSMIDTEQIRYLISYVPQEPSIVSGTIRSNIIFSKPDANEDEIINVANITGIMEFAQDLKEGLNTEIGEKGVRLSGGQRQRIAISRAILYKPEILLLDEAMSALDSKSEQKLLSSIQQLMKGKTILSIAHRIASIEQANEILLIDQGKLVARGAHNKLLENSEIYQIICKEQSINLKVGTV